MQKQMTVPLAAIPEISDFLKLHNLPHEITGADERRELIALEITFGIGDQLFYELQKVVSKFNDISQ